MTRVKDGDSQKISSKRLENITAVSQPGSKYLGPAPAASGSAKVIKESIFSLLDQRKVVYRGTMELGQPDGCFVNTGWENGVLALMEEDLGYAVQWDVCFLHHIERPWLRLFCAIDGRTFGPDAFSGVIGKLIAEDVHLLPIVDFEPVPHPDFPTINDDIREKLSTDQKGLLFCQGS